MGSLRTCTPLLEMSPQSSSPAISVSRGAPTTRGLLLSQVVIQGTRRCLNEPFATSETGPQMPWFTSTKSGARKLPREDSGLGSADFTLSTGLKSGSHSFGYLDRICSAGSCSPASRNTSKAPLAPSSSVCIFQWWDRHSVADTSLSIRGG